MNAIEEYKRWRFKFWKILFVRKASKREGIPQVGSPKKESVGEEIATAFSYFNNKHLDLVNCFIQVVALDTGPSVH